MANTYRDLGDVPQAVDNYELAIQRQPDFAEAHFNLGLVRAQSKEFRQAAEEFRKTIEFQPKNLAAYANLMQAYADLNQPDDAIGAGRQAVAAANSTNQPELARQFESRLQDYQSHHSTPAAPSPPQKRSTPDAL
jgi:tetratricopeptide (TPR) repeat protein